MTDLYDATLDDYCRAALQSTGFHNFLKGRGGGTGPDHKVLKLRSSTCYGDSKRIAQAVSNLSSDARLNSRVSHLEGQSIFGSTKWKLDLPPGDDNDSHCHDRVNFTVPKLGRHMTPGQSRQRRIVPDISTGLPVHVAFTLSGLPVFESECANPSAWRIERIHGSSLCLCKGQLSNRRCNAKIAKYKRPTAAPTFTGIQKLFKCKGTEEKQFWFCPNDVNGCVSTRSRWILYYPPIPDIWPIKVGTNLSQVEVEGLEAASFKFDYGKREEKRQDHVQATCESSLVHPLPPKGSGDIRPKMRDNRPFWFVAKPSPEHISKMALAKGIECKVLRYQKVPSLGYGIVYTVHTAGSIAKQQLYEVTVGDFPACTCIDFISMKASALGNSKKKWICYKHIYFIL
jgi:hypothetical protein